MVAVFTGSGLGLFNTTLGGGAGGIGQGKDGQFVNLASGNLVLQSQDEQLVFRGLPVAQLRTYNSLGSLAQTGADGWLTGFERRIELLSGAFNEAGSVMRRWTGDGAYQDFVFASANTYVSTAGEGANDTLTYNGSLWTYTEGSTRHQEDYETSALQGRLRTIRSYKSDGVTPTAWDVTYDAQGRITAITANDGSGSSDALLFAYDATGYLTSVSTRENGLVKGQVSYGYDSAGRLITVTTDLTPDDVTDNVWGANNDGHLFRTTYSYVDSTSLKIATITQSDGSVVSYTYQADGKIKTVTVGDTNTSPSDGLGETLTFTYGSGTTSVTDDLGRTWVYAFDANGQLTSTTSPAVGGLSDVTTYTYDPSGNGDLLQVKTVRGATTLSQLDYQYDANGNVLWQWDAQGNAISRTYSASQQLLSETRYTGVDADRTGAGLPTGGLTTRYVYDARDRVRFIIDATGGVTEYGYATNGTGIGQANTLRQYTAATYSGMYDEASLTTWASGQRASSTLTEYAYDAWGRLKQTTAYAAVDANGAGVLDAAADLTRFVYDAQGLLRRQETVHGTARTVTGATPAGSEAIDYAYDGMGRLLGVVQRNSSTTAWASDATESLTGAEIATYLQANDAATIATTYAYLDSGHQLVVTLDSGRTRTEARNAAGRLLSVAESGTVAGATVTRTAHNYYDAAGQLRASEDANGGRSYFFYDAKGRIEAVVDSTGAVTRTSYDGADRIVQVQQYANRVTTTSWLSGTTVTKATFADIGAVVDTANDRIQSNEYDTAGRLFRQTAASGLVTTYSYDAAQRLLSTTLSDPTMPGTPDRVTRYFYDAADRVVATLDGEGYLSETHYDAAGRAVSTVRYANVSPSGYWASGTLAQLRPATNGNDQTTRAYYDARGRQVGQLDAEGYLTEWTFDSAGNIRAERRYLARVTWQSGDTLATLRSRAGSAWRESQMAYNALGQLVTQTNPEGTVTRFTYDEAGRLVRTTLADATSEVRENYRRYDVFDRLIGEISGECALAAKTALLGGKDLNDPSLSQSQLDQAYAAYGVRHSYDALGQRIESIDAQGNKTWTFYDSAGRARFVVRGVTDGNGVRNAQGEVTETRYNALGEVTDTVAYTGRVNFAVPGDRTSVGTVVLAMGSVSALDSRRQFTYTRAGQLASLTDAEGAQTQYTYNAFGERTREVQAAGTSAAVTLDYAYDRRGLLTTRTEGVGTALARTTSRSYDAFGRVTSTTDARGTVTSYSYDRLGRQLTHSQTVQGRAETWTTAYDAFDRITTVTDPLGRSTRYVYSTANRTVTVTTPEGVEVTTTHDRHGQTVSVKQTLAGGTTAETVYTYDADGHLVSTKDPLNQTATNEYDARGLLTATVDASGRRVELRYDAAGRVLQRIEDPGSGKLNLTTTYTYDAQGRQLTVTDPSNRVTQHAYDREGRITQIAQDPAGLNLRTTYAYDAQGHQVSVTEGYGTTVARTTQYTYDVLGRRTAETVDPGAGKLNLTTSFVYDANDNVIQRIDANGSVTRYYYDQANRLVHAIDPTGAVTRNWYDAAGRLCATRQFATRVDPEPLTDAMTTAQLDARLTWTNADEGEYRIYDADGRLRFRLDLAGSLEETTYDPANRITGTRRYASVYVTASAPLLAGTALPSDVTATRSDTLDQLTYNVYDNVGRVRYTVDGLGNTTETYYDKAGRVVGTRGYAVPITLDATLRAQLASGNPAALATVGTRVAAIDDDSRDLRTYQVFDGAGRLRYTIDALGAVRELFLDAAGRQVGARTYATTVVVDATLLSRLKAGATVADVSAKLTAAILADPRNSEEYQVYDAAGRVTDTIQVVRDASGAATGYVQQNYWDAAGRCVQRYELTTTIADSVLVSHLDELRAGTATHAQVVAWYGATSGTRLVRFVYDAAGRMRYELVRDGSSTCVVTEHRYDGTGREIEQITYANQIPSTTTGTETAVQAALLASQPIWSTDFSSAPAGLDLSQADNAAYADAIRLENGTLVFDPADNATLMSPMVWRTQKHVLGEEVAYRAEVTTGASVSSGYFVLGLDNGLSGSSYRRSSVYIYGSKLYQNVTNSSGSAVNTQLGTVTANTTYVVEFHTREEGIEVLVYVKGQNPSSGWSFVTTAEDAKWDSLRLRASTTAGPGRNYGAVTLDNLSECTMASRRQRTVYDAAGRVRFTIDNSGLVSERLYDGLGRVIEERSYDTPVTLAGTASEGDVLAALQRAEQVQWSTDFASLPITGLVTSAIGAYGESLVLSNGQLVFTPADRDSSVVNTAVHPTVYRSETHASSEHVVFRGEVTTGADISTTYLLFGVENTLTSSDYCRGAAFISNGVLYSNEAVSTPSSTSRQIGALATNTTYVIEAHSREGGVDYFVYVKGTDKAAGLRFSVDQPDKWDNIRLKLWSYARDGATGDPLSLDNLSESVTPSRHTSYHYDAAGRLAAVTDGLGNTESYDYDALGQQVTRTDRLGNVWATAYDAAGRKTSETSPAVTVATASATGVVTTASRAVVTSYAYDAFGNVLSRTEDAGQATARTTTYEYDNRGNQIRTIFPRAWMIDAATGNLVDTVAATQIQITYDALGRAVVQKDVRENYSYKVYDLLGRIAYEIDPEGNVTGYSYNAFGEQTQLTRYANKLDFSKLSGWTAGSEIKLSQITIGAGLALVADSNTDRGLITTYDVRGNKTSVAQGTVTYYRNDGTSASTRPTTQFVYNVYGELVKESVLLEGTAGQADAVWANTYRYYDALGRNDLTVDAEGYVTRTLFNARGEAIETTEYARALAGVSVNEGTRPGLPASGDATTGEDRTTRWTYDAMGRKASEIVVRRYQNSDGSAGVRDVETIFAYDAESHVTGVTTEAGTVTTAYDALGRAISVREPTQTALTNTAESALLASTGTTLGSAGLYQQVSPYTTVAYDAFGNTIQVRRYANGWAQGAASAVADNSRDQIQVTRYDRQGRAVWERDAENNVVTREYDGADNVIAVAYRLDGNDGRYANVRIVSEYDKVGRQTYTEVTRDQYDGATWKPTAVDNREAVAYNAFGEIVAKSDTVANLGDATKSVRFTYNKVGLLIASNAESGATRRYGYNLAGAQVREERDWTDAGTVRTAVTRLSVDKLGRTLVTVLPSFTTSLTDTATVTQQVDRWGNVIQVIDARGYQTSYEYNSFNQVVRETRPLVLVVGENGSRNWVRPVNEWFYDAFGHLLGTKDANDHVRTNSYDSTGRLVTARDALGNATRYAYDVLGNQVYTENAVGYVTFKQYDRLNRVKAIGDYLPDTTGQVRAKTLLQQYTLNQNGDRLQVKDALNYVAKYDYDSRSQLIRSQTAAGVVMDYAYNTQGKKTLEGYALAKTNVTDTRDGETVRTNELTWDYDYFGRAIDHNDLSGRDSNYVYDSASGALSSESEGGGGLADVSKTITYYANGQVREIVEYDAAGNPNGNRFRYEYDAAGNRTLEETTFKDGNGQTTHTITRTLYDSNNRIQRVTQDDLSGTAKRIFDLTYEYDAVGNRRHVTALSGYGPNVSAVPTTNTAPVAIDTLPEEGYTVRKGYLSEFRMLFSDVFRDAEQDALSLEVKQANGLGLPGWLVATKDPSTGEIIFSASPASNLADQDITVKLTAFETNNPANTVSTTFVVHVRTNSAPQLIVAGTTDFRVKTNQAWTQEIAAGAWFRDPDVGDSLTLTVDNASSLPSWLTVDVSNPYAVHLSGTPTTSSTFNVVVRATDQSGQSVTKTFRITTAPNAAPILVNSALVPQEAIIGRDFEWLRNLSQVFTDAEGDALQVTATGMPAWMSFQYLADQATPQLKFAGRVPDNAVNNTAYTITLTATDPDGASRSITLSVTVKANRAPAVQMPSGWTAPSVRVTDDYDVTLPISSFFADPESDQIFITPIYPTGSSLPQWLHVTVDETNKTIRFHGKPINNNWAGTFSFQLKANDSEGLSSTLNVSLTVGAETAPTRTTIALSDRTLSIGRSFDFTLPSGLYTDAEGDPVALIAQVAVQHEAHYFDDGIMQDDYWVTLEALPSWLNFDAANRRFWGTVPAGTSTQDLIIRVRATDGRLTTANADLTGAAGISSDGDMTLLIRPWVNSAPTYNGGLPNLTLKHGVGINALMPSGAFTEPDGDTMSYSAQVQVGGSWVDISQLGLSINSSTGEIYGTAVNLFQTSYNAKIIARDPQGLTKEGTFTFSVTNTPPTATAITAKTVGRNVTANVNLAPYFSDVNQDTLTFTVVSGLPTGLILTSAGVITNSTSVALGNYTVTVKASDTRGGSVNATFTLTVANNPPSAPSITTQTATAGTAWSLTVPAFTDPNGDGLTYTVSGLPSWMTFDPSPTVRKLSGTPGPVGSWTITVTATDPSGASDTVSFVVNTPNVAPTIQTPIQTQSVARNTTWNFSIPANTFRDANGDAPIYSIVGALPSGVTFNGTAFGGKPLNLGLQSITVRCSDGRGGYKDLTFTLDVTNTPPAYTTGSLPDRSGQAGGAVAWTLPAGSFTDANADPLGYSLEVYIPEHEVWFWNAQDAAPDVRTEPAKWVAASAVGLSIGSDGKITGSALNPLSISRVDPGYPYYVENLVNYTYQLRIIAKDPSQASATGSFTVSVNAAPVAPSLPNKTIKSALPWTFDFNAFTDANGDTLKYTLSGLPPGLSHAAGTTSRTISGTPTTAGTWTVTVLANDGEGGTRSATFTITVQANTAPTAPTIGNQTAGVGGGFSFTVPAFTDADNDTLSYSITGLPPGLTFNPVPTSRIISGTPTTAGTYTVTVSVSDGRGGTASKAFTITVNATPPANRAPVVNLGLDSQEAWTGQPFVYIFDANAFTDPDGNQLTYTASLSSGAALPSWLTFTSSTRRFSGTPTGTQEITWQIKVTATDTLGLSVSTTFSLTKYGSGIQPLMMESEGSYTFDMSEAAPEPESLAATQTGPETTEYWYTYDANNRIRISNGMLEGGQIKVNTGDASSFELTYDAVGNEVARYHYYKGDAHDPVGGYAYRTAYDLRGHKTLEFHPQSLSGTSNGVSSNYEYDLNGQLLVKRSYFANYETREGRLDSDSGLTPIIRIGGWLYTAETYSYDNDGRLRSQTTWGRESGDWWVGLGDRWEMGDTSNQYTAYDEVLQQKTILNNDTFDAANRLTQYRYTQVGSYVHTYISTYTGGESYQEKTVTGSSSDNNYKTTTNTLTYDGWGRLASQNEHTVYKDPIEDRRRYYAYNGDGAVQLRRDGTIDKDTGAFDQTADAQGANPNYLFVHAAGQEMAELHEGGRTRIAGYEYGKRSALADSVARSRGLAEATYSYSDQLQSINGAGGYVAGGGKVVVQGETSLEDLAQRVYGTNQLWYVLAEANGLSHDSELIEGTSLNAPSAKVSTNDANTFKPYNPGEAIGSTTPSLPYIPPPPKSGCSTLAMVLIVVVVVAVAIMTAGAATAAIGAAAEAAGSTALASVATATAVGGAVTTTTTLTALGAMTVGAAAGAAGALAGQVLGSVMGVSSFSWRNVASGAITGAITGGLTQGFGSVGDAMAGGGVAGFGKAAALAVASGGANYAGQKLAGLNAGFSWKSVAISAVSSFVAAKVAPAVVDKMNLQTEFASRFTYGMTGGVVSAAVRSSFGETLHKADYLTIAADAFGNALGNAVVRGQANRAARTPNSEQVEAGQRILSGSTASLSGGGGETDPLDFLRQSDDFQSALDKLGGDAKVLYDTEVWSIAQHANDGTGMTANFGSGRVALSADETSALSQFLELSGAVTYAEDGSVAASMALVARKGVTIDQVSATIKDTLGRFVTDWDVSDLTQNLSVRNGVVASTGALNLMPLQETVIERFNIAVFGSPSALKAQSEYENASVRLINPFGESGKTFKQQALENYQGVTNAIHDRLIDNGYMPKRIAYSERMMGVYKTIGDLMLGVVPAERLAAPLLKPVLRVGESLLPRLGANSITGRVMKAYQSFYDDAFKAATDAYANGRLRVPPRMNATTAIGNRADRAATDRLNQWLEREGLSSDVRVNRRLSDPSGSGAYRRPDIHIQSERTIIDGTIGTKTLQTPQIKDFITYSQGNTIIIVQPNKLPTLLYGGH